MELSVRDYKRAIADGKIDNWSPKDIEQWLHSDVRRRDRWPRRSLPGRGHDRLQPL